MPRAAVESRSKMPPARNVARFNKPGRELPKTEPSVNGSASIKPRLLKHGYIRFLTIADLDSRSRAAAFAKNLAASLESDLGGDVTAGQKQLVQRAAVVSAICEDFETRFLLGHAIELSDYLTATNVLRRVLATVGLERRARDVSPTLSEYLAHRHEDPLDEVVDVEAAGAASTWRMGCQIAGTDLIAPRSAPSPARAYVGPR
jgi:hypothetical protein